MAAYAVSIAATVGSAIGAKELQSKHPGTPAMAMVSVLDGERTAAPLLGAPELVKVDFVEDEPELAATEDAGEATAFEGEAGIRWFNGRPARPAKRVMMTVTGYSPDSRSCGDSADGLTATLHSVRTNNGRLVAADPTVLPYGSMLTVPGYAQQTIVPVLDCGGAIKGRKLDLLFATHAEAITWGRKQVAVTIWEYADGKPADDPRKLR